MKIKLGIAPIAWSNDDMPELGGDTPIETCLYESKIAGFTGIELGGKFPRNPGIAKFLLNKFDIVMPGGWYGSKLNERNIEEEWNAMQDQINLLKYLDASVFIFADVSQSIQGDQNKSLSQRPKLQDNEWLKYSKKISEILTIFYIELGMLYFIFPGTFALFPNEGIILNLDMVRDRPSNSGRSSSRSRVHFTRDSARGKCGKFKYQLFMKSRSKMKGMRKE